MTGIDDKWKSAKLFAYNTKSGLDIESEMHDIAVFHHISFSFNT